MEPLPDRSSPPEPRPDPTSVGAGYDFSDPDSSLAPYYLQTHQIIAVFLVGFGFTLGTMFYLWHTDIWGHMRYGQWMHENHRIPDGEPFSPWWDGRQPFTQFYTISQLGLYYVYVAGERLAGGDDVSRMAGGVEMLRVLHGIFTALRFTILIAAFLRFGRSWPVALLGLVAVLLLDLSNLAVLRPQIFGQVFCALLLLAISRDVVSRRALVGLPVMFAVWANTHGSYLIGFILLVLLLVGRIYELATLTGKPWRDYQVQRLALVIALSLTAAGTLNPYGLSYYQRTLALGNHPSLLTAVGEWKSLTFEWAPGWHWILLLSLIVIAATVTTSRRSVPPAHVLILILFGIGAGLQTRMVIWWAMLVPWVLIPHWVDLASRFEPYTLLPPGIPSLRKTMLAVVIALAAFMWSTPAGWVIDGKPSAVEDAVSPGTPWRLARQLKHPEEPDAAWLPELATIMQKNYPDRRFTGSILATPMQGDYLMWALAPDIPVTYTHIHLFHPDFWQELGIVGSGSPGWWDVLEKYQVNLVIVEADFAPDLCQELTKSPGWKIVLDETGSPDKPQPLNRQLIAVRIHPLLNTTR